MNKLWLTLLVIGCGGSKEDGAPSSSASDKTASTTPPADQAPDKPATTASKEADADTSHGHCRYIISGPVQHDETIPHKGGSMLNVMQWHSEEMRTSMGYGKEGMILNCLGKNARLNILTRKDAKAGFPMKPASYDVGGKTGSITLMGSVKPAGTGEDFVFMGADGKLDITAFDEKHIAGKLVATAKTMPTTPEPLSITIEFDLQCKGLSGCPK